MGTHLRFAGAVVVATVFLLFTASAAMGAGFALIEQSVSGLGTAYAGGSAAAEDATTVYFNPAGMTRLSGNELIANAHLIIPSVKFNNEGSTQVLQPKTGIPLLGGNGGDAGVTKVIPNFYYTRKQTEQISFGIGINAPFGLATEYDSGWVGRYYALESDLLTVNINPSIAYKFNNHFSVGAGISLQYIKAKLSNAIDFGTLDALGTLGLPPGALKLTPQLSDGYVKMEADSWGVGFNLGALYEFTPNTRVGAAYRSRIKQKLEGDAEFSNVPAALTPAPVFKNTGAEADVTLPDSLSISVSHSFTPELTVMADFTWTNWSLFKELRVEFDNPAQPDAVTTEDWQDSYRYSLGMSYKPNKDWTLRAGVAYDTSAVADEQHRTPSIPDEDRTWIALGFGYKASQMVTIDMGYAHLFVKDPKINKSPTGEDTLKGGLKGTYDTSIDIIGVQLTMRF